MSEAERTAATGLNWLDRTIAFFSPLQGARRAHARSILARYEAGNATRLRKFSRDTKSGLAIAELDAAALRSQARHLERNHDLARAGLNVGVRNIVGANGIGLEFMPKAKDGSTHEEFADALAALWKDFRRRPEVTWTMGLAQVERLVCRAWLRDGEMFAQTLEGSVPLLDHGTRVPLSLELLEADLVPLDYQDEKRQIRCGIERNAWGRPRAFHVYKQHPGDGLFVTDRDLKRVPAERMLRLMLGDRIGQLRGVSALAAVITRLEDLKDYEESERVAAKIAASMAAFIRKGDATHFNPPAVSVDPAARLDPVTKREAIRFQAGMVFDGLEAGEDIGLIKSDRPNTNLQGYRDGQLRAVAGGMDVGYSSMSRNYNGTYSAQRQELVEQWAAYASLTDDFVQAFSFPVLRKFVDLAIASGALRLPSDLDESTIYDAEFRGPAMPWINPLDEVMAARALVRSGFKSRTQVIRERGGNPWETMRQIADERTEAEELGLVLEDDAGMVSNAGVTQARPPGADWPEPGEGTAAAISRAKREGLKPADLNGHGGRH